MQEQVKLWYVFVVLLKSRLQGRCEKETSENQYL